MLIRQRDGSPGNLIAILVIHSGQKEKRERAQGWGSPPHSPMQPFWSVSVTHIPGDSQLLPGPGVGPSLPSGPSLPVWAPAVPQHWTGH